MFDLWKHCNAAHTHVKVLFFSLFYLEGETGKGWERGRVGERERGGKGRREGGREGGRERGRERRREGEKEGGREGGREREERREGGQVGGTEMKGGE